MFNSFVSDTVDAEKEASSYIEKKDWQSLALLVERTAGATEPSLVEAQRNWIELLPDHVKFSHNYLLWLSINLHPPYIHQASAYFSKTYQDNLQAKNYLGAFAIWSAYANLKFYYLDRFSDVEGWLDQADKLLTLTELPEDDNTRSSFCVAYFNALMFARPEKEKLIHWADILSLELLHSENCHIKTSIYNNLIFFHLRIGNLQQAKLLHKEALGLNHPDAQHPFNVIMQSNIFSMVDWLNLRSEKAIKTIKNGLAHAEAIQIKTWNAQLYSQIVYANICSGDFVSAHKALHDVEKNKDSSQVLDTGQYHYLLGWLSLCEDDLANAETHLLRALDLVKEASVQFSESVIRVCLAQAYIAQNKLKEPVNHLAEAESIADKMGSKHLHFAILLARSWLMNNLAKESACLRFLDEALKIAAKEEMIVIPGWPHNIMSVLLEKALHEEIQVEYAKVLISKHKIVPTGKYPNHPDWPWHAVIGCFNNFQLTVKGKVQEQHGKAQRKPIELIQLLTFYPEGLAKYKIVSLLYVDEDIDKANQALDTTIFRARKLLKNKEAIIITKDKYRLNPQLCHANLMDLKILLQSKPEKLSAVEILKQFKKIKKICVNLNVSDDKQEITWLATERQFTRQTVIKYLNKCAAIVPSDDQIEILHYILQLDITFEASYQKLIIAYQKQDQQIEAYKVWMQCQKVFEEVYGLSPSMKTQNLIKKPNP